MALIGLYEALKEKAAADLRSAETGHALRALIAASLAEVAVSESGPLTSKVPDKAYAMFVRDGRASRPVNAGLFSPGVPVDEIFALVFAEGTPEDSGLLDRCLYTAAMAFPVAKDLHAAGDQKSPGTFFEIFVGHIMARRYNVNPSKRVAVPALPGVAATVVPTDFIFDLAPNRRLHVPVKISTRERVVQVWAHQKLLDGMHGVGLFRGLLVCMTETNKQTKTNSVVEVCLPGQWAAYQRYIARLDRVYYLDPPAKYLALRDVYPHIQVWPMSRFYAESQAVLNPQWV